MRDEIQNLFTLIPTLLDIEVNLRSQIKSFRIKTFGETFILQLCMYVRIYIHVFDTKTDEMYVTCSNFSTLHTPILIVDLQINVTNLIITLNNYIIMQK